MGESKKLKEVCFLLNWVNAPYCCDNEILISSLLKRGYDLVKVDYDGFVGVKVLFQKNKKVNKK